MEQSKCKNYQTCQEDYAWNNSTCCCENSKYLGRIIDDSVIICDEIINIICSVLKNVTRAVSINFDDKNNEIWNGLLYSARGFTSDHITINNHYYLLSLYKTKI